MCGLHMTSSFQWWKELVIVCWQTFSSFPLNIVRRQARCSAWLFTLNPGPNHSCRLFLLCSTKWTDSCLDSFTKWVPKTSSVNLHTLAADVQTEMVSSFNKVGLIQHCRQTETIPDRVVNDRVLIKVEGGGGAEGACLMGTKCHCVLSQVVWMKSSQVWRTRVVRWGAAWTSLPVSLIL